MQQRAVVGDHIDIPGHPQRAADDVGIDLGGVGELVGDAHQHTGQVGKHRHARIAHAVEGDAGTNGGVTRQGHAVVDRLDGGSVGRINAQAGIGGLLACAVHAGADVGILDIGIGASEHLVGRDHPVKGFRVALAVLAAARGGHQCFEGGVEGGVFQRLDGEAAGVDHDLAHPRLSATFHVVVGQQQAGSDRIGGVVVGRLVAVDRALPLPQREVAEVGLAQIGRRIGQGLVRAHVFVQLAGGDIAHQVAVDQQGAVGAQEINPQQVLGGHQAVLQHPGLADVAGGTGTHQLYVGVHLGAVVSAHDDVARRRDRPGGGEAVVVDPGARLGQHQIGGDEPAAGLAAGSLERAGLGGGSVADGGVEGGFVDRLDGDATASLDADIDDVSLDLGRVTDTEVGAEQGAEGVDHPAQHLVAHGIEGEHRATCPIAGFNHRIDGDIDAAGVGGQNLDIATRSDLVDVAEVGTRFAAQLVGGDDAAGGLGLTLALVTATRRRHQAVDRSQQIRLLVRRHRKATADVEGMRTVDVGFGTALLTVETEDQTRRKRVRTVLVAGIGNDVGDCIGVDAHPPAAIEIVFGIERGASRCADIAVERFRLAQIAVVRSHAHHIAPAQVLRTRLARVVVHERGFAGGKRIDQQGAQRVGGGRLTRSRQVSDQRRSVACLNRNIAADLEGRRRREHGVVDVGERLGTHQVVRHRQADRRPTRTGTGAGVGDGIVDEPGDQGGIALGRDGKIATDIQRAVDSARHGEHRLVAPRRRGKRGGDDILNQ